MISLEEFMTRCTALAEKRGWKRSTLSTRLFNDGSRLDQLANGKDIGTRRLERAITDLTTLESERAGRSAPQQDAA